MQGITGDIRFDNYGMRNESYIEVLELDQMNGRPDFQKFATYEANNTIQLHRNSSDLSNKTQLSIQTKVFKVIIHDEKPFVQLKKPDYSIQNAVQNVTENDKYEGFAVDLIAAIAKISGFKYEITTGKVTGKENIITKEWDGIVGKLVRKVSIHISKWIRLEPNFVLFFLDYRKPIWRLVT